MYWYILTALYNLSDSAWSCTRAVMHKGFTALNRKGVWCDLKNTHSWGNPPSLRLSDSPQKRLCQLRVFVTLPAMATPLICGVALPSGLTLTRRTNTHTFAQKAWLRRLTSSLLGNVIVPHKPPLDRHFIGSTVAFWALELARITMYSLPYRPQSSCDRGISCSHIQIEAPLHAEPHTICHMVQYFWH